MTRETCGLLMWCVLFLVLGIEQIVAGAHTIQTKERWIRKAFGRRVLRLKTRKVVGRTAQFIGAAEVISGIVVTIAGALISVCAFILRDTTPYGTQITQASCLSIVVVLEITYLLRTIAYYIRGQPLDGGS
jgi:hypothetical protein